MEPIRPESFQRMPVKSKLDILYDAILDINKCSCEALDKINILEKKVDKRKVFDTSISGGTGLIGGFIAFLMSKIWK